MGDIFVSYKREDQQSVGKLVNALTDLDLSVWWDAHIEAGTAWRRQILDRLEAAKIVLVVWSQSSAGPAGEFVQDEAAHAKERGVYLPISIDGTAAPLGFRQVQVLPLQNWNGDTGAPQFEALLKAIQARLGMEVDPSEPRVSLAQKSEKPTIAVLPFRHPPNDEDQAYFAEGMGEDIIAGLSRSRLLRVTSRQSSFSYDANSVSTQQACADLSVRYLVRGQIRKMGNMVRVRVDLIDGESDETIWSGSQDRSIDDIFLMQDSITHGIVATIEPALLGREQEAAVRRPQSLAHWDLFIRGRYHYWRSTPEDFRKAEESLLKSLEIEPDDSRALALLAMNEIGEIWSGRAKDFQATIKRAHDFAMRAVAADAHDANSHWALGVILTLIGQFDQAMAEQRRSLDLAPGNAQALGELGRLLAYRGDPEEAIKMSDEALSLSPSDPLDWLWLRSNSIAALRMEHFDKALQYVQDSLTRRPEFFFNHLLLSVCLVHLGDMEGAERACARGIELNEQYDLKGFDLGHPFAEGADREKYIEALRKAGWNN